MKNIFILLAFLLPFFAKTQDVFIGGSNSINTMVARNNLLVNGYFYLGTKDTTFTPTSSGCIVTAPQVGINAKQQNKQ